MEIKSCLRALVPAALWQKGSTIKHFLDKRLYADFSQAGETKAIRKALGVNRKYSGFFVEIGANDGVTLSTTLGLVKDGWSGLSVEANRGSSKS